MPSKYIAFLPVQNFLRSRWNLEDDWLWKTAGVRKTCKTLEYLGWLIFTAKL